MQNIISGIMIGNYRAIALHDRFCCRTSFPGDAVVVIVGYILVVNETAHRTLVPLVAGTRSRERILTIRVNYLLFGVAILVIFFIKDILRARKIIRIENEIGHPSAILLKIIRAFIVKYARVLRTVHDIKPFAESTLRFGEEERIFLVIPVFPDYRLLYGITP